MEKIAKFIVKIRYLLFGGFVGLFIVMSVCFFMVGTNYDMTKYLRENSPSKEALTQMEETFGQISVVNLVFTEEQDLYKYKEQIQSIDGVILVLHEDSAAYVQDNNYLLKIFISEGIYASRTAEIVRELSGLLKDCPYHMASASVSFTFLQDAVGRDMIFIVLIASAVLLVVLFITCSSWIDPLLLGLTLFVGIVINMGSNLILGEISFITRAICMVMQFALSMDFSVVLLHRYKEERETAGSKTEALVTALKSTVVPVGIAGITTIAGLVALAFMDFKLGFDIGIVLAKGVIISLLTTFLFMPALLYFFDGLIQKTKKKAKKASSGTAEETPEKPAKETGGFTKFQISTKIILPVLVVLLSVGGFFLSSGTVYSYQVSTSKNAGSKIVGDELRMQEIFGYNNSFVVVMDRDDESELQLVDYLSAYTYNGKLVFNDIQSIVLRKLDVPMTVDEMIAYAELNLGLKALVVEAVTANPPLSLLSPVVVDGLVGAGIHETVSYIYEQAGVGRDGRMSPLEILDFLSTKPDKPGFIEQVTAQIKAFIKTTLPFVNADEVVDMFFDGAVIQQSIDDLNEMALTSLTLLRNSNKVRMVLNMNMPVASEDSFAAAGELRKELLKINPNLGIVSETAIFSDIQVAFSKDVQMVSLITIIGIFLCVLIAFKNPLFPLILVFILQASSWISNSIVNIAFPPLFFITHIMVMCIMMGACDDYAIVFADYYKEERLLHDKKKSLREAFRKSIVPILTSGSILVLSALIVAFATEVQIISDIGLMLALECTIAIGLIIFALPQIVYLFDKFLLWNPVSALKEKFKRRKLKKP